MTDKSVADRINHVEGRNVEKQRAARTQNAAKLTQSCHVVFDMLEHVARVHIFVGSRRYIGDACVTVKTALLEFRSLTSVEFDAVDPQATAAHPARERADACTKIENACVRRRCGNELIDYCGVVVFQRGFR